MPIPKKCNEIVMSDYPTVQSCLDVDSKTITFADANSVTDLIKSRSNFKSDTSFKGLETDTHNLVLQDDGNLVVYKKAGSAVWASGTNEKGEAPYSLLMQGDGNLVIYDKTRPIWASGTFGTGPFNLELKPDGTLEITDSTKAVTWKN
jgi:hypothetical protein